MARQMMQRTYVIRSNTVEVDIKKIVFLLKKVLSQVAFSGKNGKG